jgi:mediator of RNA polymerase II transcription subunit 16
MVTDIDNGMKNFYQTIPDPARLELEQELILKSNVPQSLMSIVSRTIAAFQKNLIPEINVPRLYFYDVSWLNLDGPELLYDEEVGENMNNSNDSQLASDDENTKIDVLRKNVISLSESVSNGRLRRCVRCGGYSLWDDPKSTPFTQWTLAFSRNCVCGGTWYGVIQ